MKHLTTIVLSIALFAGSAHAGEELHHYIERPDDSYRYSVRQHLNLDAVEAVELTLTSQTWRGIPWRHRLFVLKPEQMTAPRQGMLVIAGGRWRDGMDAPPDPQGSDIPREARLFTGLAKRLGSPVAVLMHVPFQPLFDGLHEDAAIAYTFDQYLRGGESDWPLLLPMTRSAVRAMDAVQTFAREQWAMDVEHFTVTGGSKRGWTTWLTGAVDSRVNAIAPMVIDMLNLEPQMRHQIDAWGAFSDMIHDYTDLDIIDRLDTPEGQRLRAIVDPYAYRERLTMPKLVVLGTNDPYWPVDASNLYWDGLLGSKYLLHVANAGHGLEAGLVNVLAGLVAMHRAAAGSLELPKLAWTFDESDAGLGIRVTSDRRPKLVQAWSASTPTRDFRSSQWTAQTLMPTDGGYTFHLPRPDAGHAAAYVDLVFEDGDLAYNLTTQVRVIGVEPVTGE